MKILLLGLLLVLNLSANPEETKEKLILVYIEMESCPWCHKMNKETMDNKDARAEIEKRYIVTKIKKESGDIPSFLPTKFYPTTYLLSPDGSVVLDELPGYMKRERLLDYIKDAYEIEMEE